MCAKSTPNSSWIDLGDLFHCEMREISCKKFSVKYLPWLSFWLIWTVESFLLNFVNASDVMLCTLNSRLCGESTAVSKVKICLLWQTVNNEYLFVLLVLLSGRILVCVTVCTFSFWISSVKRAKRRYLYFRMHRSRRDLGKSQPNSSCRGLCWSSSSPGESSSLHFPFCYIVDTKWNYPKGYRHDV